MNPLLKISKICTNCKLKFKARRDSLYCSPKCRRQAWGKLHKVVYEIK